jgi:hypothetical protein
MVPCALILAHSEIIEGASSYKGDVVRIENLQKDSLDALPSDQQQVYHQLGPLYQNIYLYALNDEERHRVVVYVRRGVSSFEAINIILRAEERKFQGKPNTQPNRSTRPSDRYSGPSSQNQEIY